MCERSLILNGRCSPTGRVICCMPSEIILFFNFPISFRNGYMQNFRDLKQITMPGILLSRFFIQVVTLLAPLSALKRQTLDVVLRGLGWMHGRDDGGRGAAIHRCDGMTKAGTFQAPLCHLLCCFHGILNSSDEADEIIKTLTPPRHQISSTMIWANRDRSRWPHAQSMKVHWLWQFDLDQSPNKISVSACARLSNNLGIKASEA